MELARADHRYAPNLTNNMSKTVDTMRRTGFVAIFFSFSKPPQLTL
jgi:hypothetical protein